jgi:hypothetical protein
VASAQYFEDELGRSDKELCFVPEPAKDVPMDPKDDGTIELQQFWFSDIE